MDEQVKLFTIKPELNLFSIKSRINVNHVESLVFRQTLHDEDRKESNEFK